MDTYNQSQQQTNRVEDFLDVLEQAETAEDVEVLDIEEGEAAYQEYLAGRDSGKSLSKIKAELSSQQFF